MSGNCYVARSPEIAARRLGNEMMIMSGRDSTLFTLNDTATAIWEAADGSATLDEIVTRTIAADFEVDFEQARQDAQELADGLVRHGILLRSEEPIRAIAQERARPALKDSIAR